MQLLDYEGGDEEDVFCLNFDVQTEWLGETKVTPLVPGGSDKAVTASNKAEYVEKYTQWYLVDSVNTQFQAFLTGFVTVLDGPALRLFEDEDLELMVNQERVCGALCCQGWLE